MNREVKELKRIARGNLTGNYMEMIRAFIACDVIVSLIEMPFALMKDNNTFSTSNMIYYAAVILIGIASVVLTAGQYRMHLQLARTGMAHPQELFVPARYYSNPFILTQALLFAIYLIGLIPLGGAVALVISYDNTSYYIPALVLAVLGSVLLIYISLTFDLVYFVMNDHEDLSMVQALKHTMQLVNGHKKQYFYLQLSFLGMMLLSLLSLGIGMFWVQPYMVQTITLFYLDIKGELNIILEKRQKNGPVPEPTIINHYV